MRRLIVFLLLVCCAEGASAQTPSDAEKFWNRLHELEAGGPFSGKNFCQGDSPDVALVRPVIGQRHDGWPKQVQVTGRVIGLRPGYCGMACNAATLLVEVSETNKPLPSPELFVFTWCVFEEQAEKYCGRTVRFTATKLRSTDDHCGIGTSFDSKGAPFFVVADADSGIEILATPEPANNGDQAPNSALQRSHSHVTSRAQGGTGRAARRAAERER